MIELGKHHTLKVSRKAEEGIYLVDEENKEVLLPEKLAPETIAVDTELEVFVYKDNDQLLATTEQPFIELGEFACLEVVNVSTPGAFLDWGLSKNIFCPFKEQKEKMEEGSFYLVYLYLDELTNRLAVSSKIDKFLSNNSLTVSTGDEVDLIIGEPSDIGVNVIINNKHKGLIFNNEIFQRLHFGDEITGYIKNIRPDKKIDVALQKQGYDNVEPNAQKILIELDRNDGFIALNDKSDPDDIYAVLEMSKKTFKKSIGALYKQRLIEIKEDGIYLV